MLDAGLVVAICLAGGLGSVLRLVLGKYRGKLPWGTLIANLLAGVVLGPVLSANSEGWISAVLFVGIAGGLSTFSGVAAETGQLIRAKKYLLATGNLAANLLLPVVAVYLPMLTLATLVN